MFLKGLPETIQREGVGQQGREIMLYSLIQEALQRVGKWLALSTQTLLKQLSRGHFQLKETAVPGRCFLSTHPWSKESLFWTDGIP